MPDTNDTPTPPPLPPTPISDRELLERMEQWIGRIARATGSGALTLKQFAESMGGEVGQLHGGLLVLDGAAARLEHNQHVIARALDIELDHTPQTAGGEPKRPPRKRRRTPTDQFDLPAGVTLEVPKRKLRAWLAAWKAGKIVWYVILGVSSAIAWGWHFYNYWKLHR